MFSTHALHISKTVEKVDTENHFSFFQIRDLKEKAIAFEKKMKNQEDSVWFDVAL